MTRPVGNPNIANTPNVGPTSPVGKLVNSINKYKNKPVGSQAVINPDSMAAKVVDFDKSTPEATKKSLEAYHNFVNWALNRKSPTKDLTEIAKLEGMMAALEAQLSNAVEKRLGEGKELSDKDRKDMFLMKDILKDINEMKYGRKQINLNTSYKDIRDAMFEE